MDAEANIDAADGPQGKPPEAARNLLTAAACLIEDSGFWLRQPRNDGGVAPAPE